MAINDVKTKVTAVNAEGSINASIGGSPTSNYEVQLKEANAIGIKNLAEHGIEFGASATTHDIMQSIAQIPPLQYAKTLANLFHGAEFPSDTELTLYVPFLTDLSKVFSNSLGVKKITLKGRTPQIANVTEPLNCDNSFSSTNDLEVIDITDFYFDPENIAYIINNARSLREIRGVIYAQNITIVKNAEYAFYHCPCLEEVRFAENSINGMCDIPYSPLLSAETVQSIIDGLNTMTAFEGVLTLHADVVAKLTEEQMTEILNKNWLVQ